MRIFCYSTIMSLTLGLVNIVYAKPLIFGFDEVVVTQNLTTEVKFVQNELKKFSKNDNLKLRVFDKNQEIRTDAILNKNGAWVWNKVLPFSEDLKLVILKDNKPISKEYYANNKSQLAHPVNSELPLPIAGRGIYNLPIIEKPKQQKINLTINFPDNLKNCTAHILAVILDKENKLLWQSFDPPKENLKTGDIDYSEGLQSKLITDENSCLK